MENGAYLFLLIQRTNRKRIYIVVCIVYVPHIHGSISTYYIVVPMRTTAIPNRSPGPQMNGQFLTRHAGRLCSTWLC